MVLSRDDMLPSHNRRYTGALRDGTTFCAHEVDHGASCRTSRAACAAAAADMAFPANSSPHLPCFFTPHDQHLILTCMWRYCIAAANRCLLRHQDVTYRS